MYTPGPTSQTGRANYTQVFDPNALGWGKQAIAGGTGGWTDVTYGNGVYVAVNSAGLVNGYSTDGVNLTTTTNMPASLSWNGVTFGGGVFVAVPSNATNTTIASSTDGINWTARTLPSSGTWKDVTYGGGQFVACQSTFGHLAYSSDGVTWTDRNIGLTLPLTNICYGGSNTTFGGTSIFMAWSVGATAYETFGNPASSGTAQKAFPVAAQCVAATLTQVLVFGPAGQVYSSADGSTWTLAAVLPYVIGACQWFPGLGWIATPHLSAGNVYLSPDGINWSVRPVGPALSPYLPSIMADNNPSGGNVFTLGSTAHVGYWTQANITPTWTAPSGCHSIDDALLVGGGGAGGTGYVNTNYAMAGGGGGGAVVQSRIPVVPGTTYAVNIGAGGAGQGGTATTTGYVGFGGGTSSIASGGTTLVSAAGGGGGATVNTTAASGACGGGAAGGGGGGAAGNGVDQGTAILGAMGTFGGKGGGGTATLSTPASSGGGAGGPGINGYGGGGGGTWGGYASAGGGGKAPTTAGGAGVDGAHGTGGGGSGYTDLQWVSGKAGGNGGAGFVRIGYSA